MTLAHLSTLSSLKRNLWCGSESGEIYPLGKCVMRIRFGSLARRWSSKNIADLGHIAALSHVVHEKWLVKTSKREAVLNRRNFWTFSESKVLELNGENSLLIFLSVLVSLTACFHFQLHIKILSSEPKLLEELSKLSMQLEDTWIYLRALFNQSLCVLTYMKSALL